MLCNNSSQPFRISKRTFYWHLALLVLMIFVKDNRLNLNLYTIILGWSCFTPYISTKISSSMSPWFVRVQCKVCYKCWRDQYFRYISRYTPLQILINLFFSLILNSCIESVVFDPIGFWAQLDPQYYYIFTLDLLWAVGIFYSLFSSVSGLKQPAAIS